MPIPLEVVWIDMALLEEEGKDFGGKNNCSKSANWRLLGRSPF